MLNLILITSFLFHEIGFRIDIYFDAMYTWVCYISLKSQKKELSQLMSYVNIHKVVTKLEGQEMVNWLFKFYFLNWDISIIKFHTLMKNIQMERTRVSDSLLSS